MTLIISVEFDPFGYSVNDLQMGNKVMKCDSTGDLYPIFTNNQAISSPTPSTFTVLSPSLWHNRLGHWVLHTVLRSFRNNNFSDYTKT